jgi:hypothetical protein
MRARVAGIQETLGSVAVLFDSRYSPSRCFAECENSSLGPGGCVQDKPQAGETGRSTERVFTQERFAATWKVHPRGLINIAGTCPERARLGNPHRRTLHVSLRTSVSCPPDAHTKPATARKTACGCPRETPPRVAGQSTNRGPTALVSSLLTIQGLRVRMNAGKIRAGGFAPPPW